MTWLDLISAATFTGSLCLCTGILIGTRNRDVYNQRDAARTYNQHLEQQLTQARNDNLELLQRGWNQEADSEP